MNRSAIFPLSLGLLLLGLLLIKLCILGFIGPSPAFDAPMYIDFADKILNGGLAFSPLNFARARFLPELFRLAGYPLILAAAKLAVPSAWAGATVIFQSLLTLLTLWLIFRVLERAFHSAAAALVVVALYGFSTSLLLDNSILSDSVYSSLFNIVLFVLLGHLVGCWRLNLGAVVGLGFLWGYSTWTRDSGMVFTVLPMLLLAVMGVQQSGAWTRRMAPLVAFSVVVAAMVFAYALLNLHRTGEMFFSITGAANWLRPLFDMQRYGYAHPFGGSDLISTLARETMTDYDFGAQMKLIDLLFDRCACTPTQLQSMVFAQYVSGIIHHPVAYVGVIYRNFNFMGLATDVADPLTTFNQFVQLGTTIGKRVIPGPSIRNIMALKAHFSLSDLLLMIAATVSATIAGLVFALFLFGIPVLVFKAWRRRQPDAALAVAGFCWFSFMLVSFAFSLVHYEARHALPVFPAAQAGIVFAVMQLRQGKFGVRWPARV